MVKIQCVIVDDEAPARNELAFLLSAYEDIEVVAEAENSSEALSVIEKYSPQLVFLDIQMPREDGFSVIQAMSDKDNVPLFVFVTAYNNYAVKAFEANAVDYLLKPLSEKRLSQTIERIRHRLSNGHINNNDPQVHAAISRIISGHNLKIVVEQQGRMHLLSPNEIAFFKYENNKIWAYTHFNVLPVCGFSTLDSLEKHLTGLPFFRAHRSILVNLDQIKEFSPWFNGKYCLIMNDDKKTELTVSRARVKEFKRRLGI